MWCMSVMECGTPSHVVYERVASRKKNASCHTHIEFLDGKCMTLTVSLPLPVVCCSSVVLQ